MSFWIWTHVEESLNIFSHFASLRFSADLWFYDHVCFNKSVFLLHKRLQFLIWVNVKWKLWRNFKVTYPYSCLLSCTLSCTIFIGEWHLIFVSWKNHKIYFCYHCSWWVSSWTDNSSLCALSFRHQCHNKNKSFLLTSTGWKHFHIL